MKTARNLRADAFSGTAEAYLRHRPPYPTSLLEDLLARAGAREDGVAVDLACGPGRIALDLAPRLGRVVAIDLEPEMIAVGRAEAARRGLGNIDWRVGRAEEAQMAPRSVDLIAIGEAFHRLDQRRIAERAMNWLKPGGALATMGTEGLLAGGGPWKAQVAEVVRRWMAKAFPEGWAQGRADAALGPEGAAEVLRRAGFVEVETRSFCEPHDWSFEGIVGYLRSTSVCSERALGAQGPGFEAELRAALAADHDRVFRETLRASYTFARKPG
jgi:SAM-dependent methyltransferase